jgi:cell division septal protein FtsQ
VGDEPCEVELMSSMRGASAVLSPRPDRPGRVEDLAEKAPIITGQRVRRQRRLRRRVARGVRRALRAAALLAAGAAVIAGGALTAQWLMSSERFLVTEVEVRGASRLSQDAIVAASGLVPGVNLFRLDARAAVAGVEGLPEVRRADLVRHFPDRVVLHVEERRPFTLVHTGRLHWVDEQGVSAGAEPRAVALPVPVISGLSPDQLATAGRAPSERVVSGLGLTRLLLRSGGPLLSQISEIDVSRAEGPVLWTVDGIEVRLGREDWEARLPRLASVLAQVASSGDAVSSIDLRFRGLVVLKPAVR